MNRFHISMLAIALVAVSGAYAMEKAAEVVEAVKEVVKDAASSTANAVSNAGSTAASSVSNVAASGSQAASNAAASAATTAGGVTAKLKDMFSSMKTGVSDGVTSVKDGISTGGHKLADSFRSAKNSTTSWINGKRENNPYLFWTVVGLGVAAALYITWEYMTAKAPKKAEARRRAARA